VSDDAVVFHQSTCDDAPVVCILGWGGSKRKHLRHIERFYREKMQYSYVSHIMPLYCSTAEYGAYTEQILNKVRMAESAGAKKKVAHIFSNNGTWSYARLQKMHAADGHALPLMDRVVYDAAPDLWQEQLPLLELGHKYSRAILPGLLNRPQYEHPILTPIVTFALAARIALERATEEDVLLTLNRYLFEASPTVPHLFLYSSGDQLITPSDIGKFQDSMRKRGASVEQQMWGDEVTHCASLMRHPKEYQAIVASFLDPLQEERE
jgi:hypothetical protein